MKKQLLFVTHQNEETDDGLAYAVDLARTMDEGITVLLVHKKNLMEKFERAMVAVTFAEANEHETSREILAEGPLEDEQAEKRMETLLDKCRDLGVNVTVHAVTEDAVTAVKDYLKKRNGVDMVLLSPSVTDKKNLSARELQRLVKTASRPIVTMARQGIAVNQEPCYNAQ
ncbi:MAG: hypothetical protein M0Z79_09615 [Nitrospiraceae bacterium]|nr:hypothetical protein [Nitrospiraceae bacterium]